MAAPARSARQAAGGRLVSLDPNDPLIKQVSQSSEGPIVGAANILDIPGSMIRDVVQSVARKKFINPFDQLLSPSSSKNRTSGRDVRISLGLGSKRSKGITGAPADILTEILLDPLTYVNPFGALSKAGKVAQAAGLIGDAGKVAKAAGRVGSKRAAQTSTRLAELLTTPEAIKAAEKAAGGTAALEKLKSSPLRGAMGWGLTGGRDAIGHGKVAQSIARAQDVAGEAIRYGKYSPVKALATAFHKPGEGIKTVAVQKLATKWHHKQASIRAAVRARGAETIEQYQKIMRTHGPDAAKQLSAQNLRAILENPSTTKHLAGLDLPTRREFYQQFPEAEQFIDNIIARTEVMPARAVASHLPAKVLFDTEMEYFPRYKSQAVIQGGKSSSRGPKVFNTFDPSFKIERLPFLRHVAGGTEGVKRMLMDPELQRMIFRSGPSGEAAVGGYVHGPGLQRQVGKTAMEVLTDKELKNFTPAGTQELADEIERKFGDFFDLADHPRKAMSEMAEWMRGLTPEELAVGVWGNHPLADMMMRDMHVSLSTGAADSVMEALSDMDFIRTPGPSGLKVAMKDVLTEAGLNVDSAIDDLAQRLGHTPENVRDMTISKEHADDLARFAKAFTEPDSTGRLRELVDGFTNLFRGLVTGPWPSFHGRNLGSSQFANWVAGMWSGWSVAAAHNILTGKGHAKLLEIPIIKERLAAAGIPLTKEAAADMARRLVFEHEISASNAGDIGDILGKLGQREAGDIEDLFKQFPGGLGGTNPVSGKKMLRTAAGFEDGFNFTPPSSLSSAAEQLGGYAARFAPWKVRGVGGRTKSEFPLAAAGEQLGAYVEGLARISPFLDQLAKGVDPVEAAWRVKAAQVDYSGRAYTAAERQVMTRLIPFYKFSKGAVPQNLRLIAQNPGGRLGRQLRVTSGMREEGGPLPDHIADTSAIRIPEGFPIIGPKPGGDPRYLTGLGLMHEDALSFAPFGGQGIKGAGLEALSRLNPLIKGPLEFITGQSFFQRGAGGGRPLEDLDPTVGRTLRNVQQLARGEGQTGYTPPVRYPGDEFIEPLIGNMPTARAASTLRTLTDPRKSAAAKATNLLTGLRLSDVSEHAQSAALHDRASELLKEFPEVRRFTRQYIPKDRLPDMAEADRVEAQRLLQLLDLLAERGRARAKESKKSKRKARQ